jgi:catechol 2,3-dioxygenase
MVNRLISQLAHVEVITPKPEESLRFYRDVLGLEVSGRANQSVYLRGWGEFFHHSLQLTEGPQPAVAHAGWRTEGPQELEETVARLERSGAGIGWRDSEVGHGPAFRYRTPGGHVQEVFWEVERYRPPPELAPLYPNRPQRYVPRGAAARRIDHVTFNTDDPLRDAHWYRDVLGYRHTETIRFDHVPVVLGAFVSTTPMSHDLGLIRDALDRSGRLSGVPGRTNHIAFWLDQREDVLRACEVYRENGIELEFGPGRHGVGENFFTYCREPGGMRVELFSNGYMQFAPDVYPFEWQVSKGSLNFWSPSQMAPEPFLFEAFPPVPGERAAPAPAHAAASAH